MSNIDDRERPGSEPVDRPKDGDAHPAGPHATPELTNPDATPGAGALPDPEAGDVDGGAG